MALPILPAKRGLYPAMALFSDLPNELLLRTVEYLDRADLRVLRLTCKALSFFGAQALLKNFALYIGSATTSESLEGLMSNPKLMECIKHLDLWLFHDSFEQVAIRFISKLSTVNGLSFDMPYGSHQGAILDSIFKELLTKVSNLQRLRLRVRFSIDSARHGFIDNESTARILRGVEDLHLHLEQYTDRHHVLYQPQPRGANFNENWRAINNPCSNWLSPDFVNLHTLTLDFGSGWVADNGYAPKLDFRSTFFKCLCKFSLSHFLICHDWVLDWLVKHGSTLETLDLAFCPILRHRRTKHVLDGEGYIQNGLIQTGSVQNTVYHRTWGDIFTQLTYHFPVFRSLSLIWHAGRLSDEETHNGSHLNLSQGLYASFDGHGYAMVDQTLQSQTAEYSILLRDDANLARLFNRIGKANCTLEAVRDIFPSFNDIDTEDSALNWMDVDDVLEEYSVDSHGNIFTSVPLPHTRRLLSAD